MDRACAFILLAASGLAFSSVSVAQIKPATNDAAATFDSGLFTLPSLADSKDAYTILFENAATKPKPLALPAGATAIRLVSTALPPGAWSWRYVLKRDKVADIAVLSPKEERVTYPDLVRYRDNVGLVWELVPGAARYRVTTKTDSSKNQSSDPQWGPPANIELGTDDFEESKKGFYDLPLKEGTRTSWTVTALDADGQPLAESAPRLLRVDQPWSSEASGAGFKVQRSDTLSPSNAGKPALLGYSSGQKEGSPRASSYQTEFALIWDSGLVGGGQRSFYPRASLEAKLHSSGDDKAGDALRLRVGGYTLLEKVPSELTTNLKYETEAKSNTKKGLLELGWTPTFFPLGWAFPTGGRERGPSGNYLPSRLPAFQVTPQVSLAMDLGKTFSVGTSNETKKTNFRQRANLRLDGEANFLAYALRVPNVSVYADVTYWHLSGEDKHEYTYSKIGVSLKLTKELSLEASYSVGADSPTFIFTRSTLVGLGVQF